MAKKPQEVVYLHEPKPGLYVTGIPARDLTQADVDRLGAARINHAVATGMYRKATKTETAKATKEAEKAADAAQDGER